MNAEEWRARGAFHTLHGHTLFVIDTGADGSSDDKSTLVLLHGYPTSSHDYNAKGGTLPAPWYARSARKELPILGFSTTLTVAPMAPARSGWSWSQSKTCRSKGTMVSKIRFIFTALMIVACQPLAAQQTDFPSTRGDERVPVFTDEVQVTVTNVYVTVVDKHDQPVHRLTQDDFEVFEDGRPVELTHFSAYEPPAASPKPTLDTEALADATAPRADATPRQGPSYLAVVFDNTSLRKRDRRRALQSVQSIVGDLTAAGTGVMVAVADTELQVVRGFSTIETEVVDALGAVGKSAIEGDALVSRKRMLLRDIFQTRSVGAGQNSGYSVSQGRNFLMRVETFRDQEMIRLQNSFDNLEQLLRMLSGVPGRTTVMWVGGDMPLSPGVDLYEALYRKFNFVSDEIGLDQPGLWGTEKRVEREAQALAAVAQGSAVTVHYLDATDRDAAFADFGAPDVDTVIGGEAGGAAWTSGTDLAQFRGLVAGGQYVAGATGGTVLTGTRNLEPFLDRMVDLIESYYSLGYRRPGEADSRLHSIKVKVRRPGLRVRTHEKVRSWSPEERLGDAALSRLMLGAGINPLRLTLALGPQQPSEGGAVVQPLTVAVPARNLILVQQGDTRFGQLLVAICVQGPSGTPSKAQVGAMPVELRDPEQTTVELSFPLRIPQGSLGVAVVVRDELSGEEGSVAATLAE